MTYQIKSTDLLIASMTFNFIFTFLESQKAPKVRHFESKYYKNYTTFKLLTVSYQAVTIAFAQKLFLAELGAKTFRISPF